MAKPSEGIESFLDELDADTKAALTKAALSLKQKTHEQLKANFKKRTSSNFFKQVKTFVLPAKDGLPPVAYVRLGAKFMGVFQEGDTIDPGSWMILLLTDTAPKNFKRITKGNSWDKVWSEIKDRSRMITKNGKTLVLYRTAKGEVPVYLFTKVVKEKKKLSFYEAAQDCLDDVKFD
jgi:hypothetical protein